MVVRLWDIFYDKNEAPANDLQRFDGKVYKGLYNRPCIMQGIELTDGFFVPAWFLFFVCFE